MRNCYTSSRQAIEKRSYIRNEGEQGKTETQSLTNSNVDNKVDLQEKAMPLPQSCTLCPEPEKPNRDDTGGGEGELHTSTGGQR